MKSLRKNKLSYRLIKKCLGPKIHTEMVDHWCQVFLSILILNWVGSLKERMQSRAENNKED